SMGGTFLEILGIKNLSFTYAGGAFPALENISLSVNAGEFIVLCGRSGCGKTTLFNLIKRELTPNGEKKGEIFYKGEPISSLPERVCASEIGFVMQSPDMQIVTDKVWHELAFGLENLGCSQEYIRLRVGEMANYFGITPWFREKTAYLSGGQKQLLALASVMAMSPELIMLDEPTSQLDPIAAADFISTLKKINRELGVTVIIAEHRLEELFPIADKVAVMENGRLLSFGSPEYVCKECESADIYLGFPTSARIWRSLSGKGKCPLTVREGREFLRNNFGHKAIYEAKENTVKKDIALSLSDVYFRYEKNSPDILRGASVTIEKGEFFCLLGGNGAGKTTFLRVIAGLIKIYRGKLRFPSYEKGRAKISMLSQNVKTRFLKNTVKDDLYDLLLSRGCNKSEIPQKIEDISGKLGISELLSRHPYDLSGGEMQKCAIAKVMLTEPDILLLDEPTKAIDICAKSSLADIINELKKDGVTVIAVTHDVEFAAENADRCALFFDGEILPPSSPRSFFAANNFYTTASSRISRGIFDGAVTAGEIISLGKEEEC
ncbi:MAG: ABC transporter ATP-binding protein, partial [Eubacteriales bacterium]